MQKLFNEENNSREEIIRGNTVVYVANIEFLMNLS